MPVGFISLSLSLSLCQPSPAPEHIRISLPKRKVPSVDDDEESEAEMKTALSTDRLEVEFDAASDVSSERSFSYESAQAEVMMKGMSHNGESV